MSRALHGVDIDIQPLLDRAEAVEYRVVNDIAGRFVDREFARDLLAVEECYRVAVESQVVGQIVLVFLLGLGCGISFIRGGVTLSTVPLLQEAAASAVASRSVRAVILFMMISFLF